jgi:hypothetical protein
MRRASIVVAIVALVGGVGPSSSAASCWRQVVMPPVNGIIEGADFASASYGWAVGYRLTPHGVGPISLRWSGGTWRAIPVPKPSAVTYLHDVAVVSEREAWAVGEQHGGSFVVRWNGASWKRVPAPAPGRSSQLMSIDRDERTGSMMAAGYWSDAEGFHPLILRWTGTRWRASLLRLGLADVMLADIAVGRGATWAVGTWSGRYKALLLRRQGGIWKVVPAPTTAKGRWLTAVDAAGPNEAFAVGNRWEHALVLRWNGRRWRPVPATRIPGLAGSRTIHDVAMHRSGETWLAASRSVTVGSTDPDYGYHPQAIFHRRGDTWTWESPPKVPYALLLDVAPVDGSDVWALGGVAFEDGGHPLAFRC